MEEDNEGVLEIQVENPKLKKSASYGRYEGYKKAKTVAEFYKFGGTKADLKHDIKKGFIKYIQSNYIPKAEKNSGASPSGGGLQQTKKRKKERRSDVAFSPPGPTSSEVADSNGKKDEEIRVKKKFRTNDDTIVAKIIKTEPKTISKDSKKRKATPKKTNTTSPENKPKRSKKSSDEAREKAWNDEFSELGDDVCDVCGKPTIDEDDEPLPDVLICESCDCEVHLKCSGLHQVPEGIWECAKCTSKEERRPSKLNNSNISIQGPARCIKCGKPGTMDAAVFFCNKIDCIGAYHLSCFAELKEFSSAFCPSASKQNISQQLNAANAVWSACPSCIDKDTPHCPITLQLKSDAKIDPADSARLQQLISGLAPQVDQDVAKACLETHAEPVSVTTTCITNEKKKNDDTPTKDSIVDTNTTIDVTNNKADANDQPRTKQESLPKVLEEKSPSPTASPFLIEEKDPLSALISTAAQSPQVAAMKEDLLLNQFSHLGQETIDKSKIYTRNEIEPIHESNIENTALSVTLSQEHQLHFQQNHISPIETTPPIMMKSEENNNISTQSDPSTQLVQPQTQQTSTSPIMMNSEENNNSPSQNEPSPQNVQPQTQQTSTSPIMMNSEENNNSSSQSEPSPQNVQPQTQQTSTSPIMMNSEENNNSSSQSEPSPQNVQPQTQQIYISPYYIDLGWWHKFDPNSGKFYYVHEKTGATQWAVPDGIPFDHPRYTEEFLHTQ